MANEGTQLKIKFPAHLYRRLQKESDAAGVPMASLVRLAVVNRYYNQVNATLMEQPLTEEQQRRAANGS